jgi:hypothetical protein
MQTAISISLLFFSLNSFAETKDINVMSPERRAFYIKINTHLMKKVGKTTKNFNTSQFCNCDKCINFVDA